MKTILTILPCSSLAINAPAQEKSAAGVGVGIVIICVGGYCVYKVIRFCQRKFPKDKPSNTNELSNFILQPSAFSGGVGDEYGGSWNHDSLGSCLSDAITTTLSSSDRETNPTIFSLNVFVASPTELRRTMTADTRPESFQSWAEFQSEVASHGLVVTGQADGSQYFSRNSVPVSAGEVPLRFDTATSQVIHNRGGELVTVVVEASTDLENWQQLASLQHGVGEGFQIADVSGEEAQFYRVRIAP